MPVTSITAIIVSSAGKIGTESAAQEIIGRGAKNGERMLVARNSSQIREATYAMMPCAKMKRLQNLKSGADSRRVYCDCLAPAASRFACSAGSRGLSSNELVRSGSGRTFSLRVPMAPLPRNRGS